MTLPTATRVAEAIWRGLSGVGMALGTDAEDLAEPLAEVGVEADQERTDAARAVDAKQFHAGLHHSGRALGQGGGMDDASTLRAPGRRVDDCGPKAIDRLPCGQGMARR